MQIFRQVKSGGITQLAIVGLTDDHADGGFGIVRLLPASHSMNIRYRILGRAKTFKEAMEKYRSQIVLASTAFRNMFYYIPTHSPIYQDMQKEMKNIDEIMVSRYNEQV